VATPACGRDSSFKEAYYGTERGETFFAASDIGWVVGHSYIVYAPLLHGCTSVMFEGKPVGTPDAGTYSTDVCVIDY
jgi:propionyl-CoA synthetase